MSRYKISIFVIIGFITGFIFSNIIELTFIRDFAQSYAGKVRRIDLAAKSTQFWIIDYLSQRCSNLRVTDAFRAKLGKRTLIFRFKGKLISDKDFINLEEELNPILTEYQILLYREFNINFSYSLTQTSDYYEQPGFTLTLEFDEK